MVEKLNPYVISLIFVGLTSIYSTSLVMWSRPRSTAKTAWGYFSFAVGFWSSCMVAAQLLPNYDQRLHFVRIANIMSNYISPAFLYFTLQFTGRIKKQRKMFVTILIGTTVYMIICALKIDQFIPVIPTKKGIIAYPNPGSIYHLLPLQMISFAILGMYYLYIHWRDGETKSEREQAKLILVGSAIGYAGGMTNFPLMYDINLYPWGTYLIPLYVMTSTYAIYKHKFLEINLVIKRSLVYAILIAVLSITYLVVVIVMERMISSVYPTNQDMTRVYVAFGIGLFLLPVRNMIQKVVDKWIYKGTPDEIHQRIELLEKEAAEKQKYQAIATLASGIAHEIRNPITSLKVFFEFLPKKHMDKEFINKISKIGDREFDRIEELVKEMLEFARPSPPNFREEKISKVVEDTIHLLEAKAMDKKITIVRKYKYKCLKMLIDANKIKQGLMNVIQNSIEAMPNGGTITIECERKLRDYIIKIKDAGKGMTKEDIKNVFLPFYTSGKDSGTGLGMAVTKKIIEDHEGKISIRSRLKKGTEILINIPIHTKQLAA